MACSEEGQLRVSKMQYIVTKEEKLVKQEIKE